MIRAGRGVQVGLLGAAAALALSARVRGLLADALLGPRDDDTAIPPTGPSPIPPRS